MTPTVSKVCVIRVAGHPSLLFTLLPVGRAGGDKGAGRVLIKYDRPQNVYVQFDIVLVVKGVIGRGVVPERNHICILLIHLNLNCIISINSVQCL